MFVLMLYRFRFWQHYIDSDEAERKFFIFNPIEWFDFNWLQCRMSCWSHKNDYWCLGQNNWHLVIQEGIWILGKWEIDCDLCDKSYPMTRIELKFSQIYDIWCYFVNYRTEHETLSCSVDFIKLSMFKNLSNQMLQSKM